MNIYFVDKESHINNSDNLSYFKGAVREFYRGFEIKPALSNLMEDEHQFFYEGPDGLIWGKVFYEALSEENLKDLYRENELLFNATHESITLYVFFPSGQETAKLDLKTSLRQFQQNRFSNKAIRLFQYYFMQSFTEKGMALNEWIEELDHNLIWRERDDFKVEKTAVKDRLTDTSQVSREELVELIELDLELIKLRTAFPR